MAARGASGLSPRLRTLAAVERTPHRFQRLRRITLGLTVAILFAIPLSGLGRVDLWDGRHRLLFEPVGPVFGAEAFILSTVAFYVITFLLNAAFGRIFCGWGCPIGEASRLGDAVELATKTGKGRRRAELSAIGWALVLGSGILMWFVDPRVFVAGSVRAILYATAALAALTGGVYLSGRHIRWSFCTKACPIGVYYSAVQPEHTFGLKFDPAACNDCDLCTKICPVGLNPRELEQRRRPSQGGISLDDFPEAHHCLTCGDCVRACELTANKQSPGVVA